MRVRKIINFYNNPTQKERKKGLRNNLLNNDFILDDCLKIQIRDLDFFRVQTSSNKFAKLNVRII